MTVKYIVHECCSLYVSVHVVLVACLLNQCCYALLEITMYFSLCKMKLLMYFDVVVASHVNSIE